ncbi:MAG TPA: histidine phosphatase family protein [Holophagaceae bacterium]|nr:histidine phosphatase family protein [Holophagaceae bacterium]
MRVLLCRHGETPWNAEGRYQGQMDIPLSEAGERQAAALGARLKDLPLARAVASPLSRARRTAELALGHRAGMLTLEPGLQEIAHGAWEGKLAAELAGEDGPRLKAWRQAPDTVQMPGGESLQQVQDRAWPAFVAACAGLGAEDLALVVAHDAVNRVILARLLGLPLARIWSFRQAPATLNLLEGPEPGRLEVVRLNDAAHVAGLFGEARHLAL